MSADRVRGWRPVNAIRQRERYRQRRLAGACIKCGHPDVESSLCDRCKVLRDRSVARSPSERRTHREYRCSECGSTEHNAQTCEDRS